MRMYLRWLTSKGREIAHKFNTGWEVGTVRCVEKKGEFAVFYESEQQLYTHELNQRQITGYTKTGCFFRKNTVLLPSEKIST